MNKLKLLTIFSLFILLPNVANADCTKEELNYYKMISDNYEITNTFNKDSKTYDVRLYAPEAQKYSYDYDSMKEYVYGASEDGRAIEIMATNVPSGTYTIDVIGVTDTCDSVLETVNLKLNPYNYYSEDPLCEGIEEFYLCRPTYGKEVDYDTFVSRVNTYRKNHGSDKKEEQKEEENVVINKITEFITNNIFEIIAIIAFIVVITVTIILTTKSIKKRRRLE